MGQDYSREGGASPNSSGISSVPTSSTGPHRRAAPHSPGAAATSSEQARQRQQAALADRDVGFLDEHMRMKFRQGVNYNMKVIIRGAPRSGKTQLFRRLQGKPFEQLYTRTPQLQSSCIHWSYSGSSEVIKVEVWDVVDKGITDQSKSTLRKKALSFFHGQKVPLKDTEMVADASTVDVYRGTHAVVVVFDITKRDTFEYVRDLLPEIPPNVHVLVLANFHDMHEARVVTDAEAQQMVREAAKSRKAQESEGRVFLLHTSMKDCFGLGELYNYLSLPFLYLKMRVYEESVRLIQGKIEACDEDCATMCSRQDYASHLRRLPQQQAQGAASHGGLAGQSGLDEAEAGATAEGGAGAAPGAAVGAIPSQATGKSSVVTVRAPSVDDLGYVPLGVTENIEDFLGGSDEEEPDSNESSSDSDSDDDRRGIRSFMDAPTVDKKKNAGKAPAPAPKVAKPAGGLKLGHDEPNTPVTVEGTPSTATSKESKSAPTSAKSAEKAPTPQAARPPSPPPAPAAPEPPPKPVPPTTKTGKTFEEELATLQVDSSGIDAFFSDDEDEGGDGDKSSEEEKDAKLSPTEGLRRRGLSDVVSSPRPEVFVTRPRGASFKSAGAKSELEDSDGEEASEPEEEKRTSPLNAFASPTLTFSFNSGSPTNPPTAAKKDVQMSAAALAAIEMMRKQMEEDLARQAEHPTPQPATRTKRPKKERAEGEEGEEGEAKPRREKKERPKKDKAGKEPKDKKDKKDKKEKKEKKEKKDKKEKKRKGHEEIA